MPKEIISVEGCNSVEIRWGSIGQVQVSTYSPDRLIAATVDREGRNLAPEDTPFEGWFADLDRLAINKLIRVLRRARDSAFGADA